MNTRSSSNSMNGEEEKSESIPFDLIIEILTRLPSKSVARFRCLSKLCDSTLRDPNFTDSFFNVSLSRPKLFFTCLKQGETFFFSCSSPQPQNSSPLTANFQMRFPSDCPSFIGRPVRGLVSGLSVRTCYEDETVCKVCNTSTGQFFTLPKVKKSISKACLGYDPIDKQFKVLCITETSYPRFYVNYQVLTLGTGKKLSWRKMKCDRPHFVAGYLVYDEICINGVCYYFASLLRDQELPVIVCFDIRSEKFKFIRVAQDMRDDRKVEVTLVNYKDKLAKLQLNMVDGICRDMKLWVLEDAEKHEWSSYIYVLPPPREDIHNKTELRVVGRNTNTGEIVLSPSQMFGSFYLLYYSPERNTITKVEIQGMEAFKNCHVYSFLDHVEDVKLLTSV